MQLYRKSLTAGSGELVSMSAYGAGYSFLQKKQGMSVSKNTHTLRGGY